MDTVRFTSKITYIYFEYINFHTIFNAPLLYTVNIELQYLQSSADFMVRNIFK
jgi:hypothetical protein